METALASTGFVTYTYTGKTPIIFDDHNDEYELEIAQNDEFHVKLLGHSVKIRGHDSQEIFRAKTTDPKYMRLMKTSTPVDFQFIPHPRFPAYPFIPNLTFELIPKLYDFYNQRYFNGACPKRVLFKKTNAHTFLGLAQFNQDVKGKALYRMSVNMGAVAKDTILFTDVLLHEMIHLRNYHKGTMEHNDAMVGDGHGRYFKAEMARLNKLGFNIDVTLDWEKRGDASDIQLYIFRATLPDDPKNIKLFWSETDLTNLFEGLVAEVRAVEPTRNFKFELIQSSDQEARQYPKLTKTNKIPANKIKLYYKPMKIDGARVLKSMDAETVKQLIAPVKLKVAKKDEPYYALPFVLFTGHMRKLAPRATDAELRSLWVQFPIEKIVPYATEQLGEIFKGIGRGVNEADTKRRLSVVYAMFDDRSNPVTYRTTIRTIIEQRKWTALLNYPQLGV